MLHKLSKTGYIYQNGKLESLSYRDYLYYFGSDETTTPRGVAPRLYVEGKKIYTWGVNGNNHRLYAEFSSKREATEKLYEIWESYISEKNWDAPEFFATKEDFYTDFAERKEKHLSVVKRYFRILDKIEKREISEREKAKIEREAQAITTKENIIQFIENNIDFVRNAVTELDELKEQEKKDLWQIKANALIQKVSNNDFRALKWKEIYQIIRTQLL